MDALEEWWPVIGEWLSRTTVAVGAIVGILGLMRTLVEVGRKRRLRRTLEKNLRIFTEIPSSRAKEDFEKLVNSQAFELLMLEGTPFLRRPSGRFVATLTFASLAIAGLLYSRDSKEQWLTTLIQYASLGTLAILATHIALRVLSRLATHARGLRNLPERLITTLDVIAEDGLIRILAWRLGYLRRPIYEAMDLRPQQQEYVASSSNEYSERRRRLSEVVEYLRTGR